MRLQETLVILDALVRISVNLTHHLDLCAVEVFCRVMECLITAIHFQMKRIDFENKSAASKQNDPVKNLPKAYQSKGYTEMESFFKELLSSVEKFVKEKLSEFDRVRSATKWNEEFWVTVLTYILWYPSGHTTSFRRRSLVENRLTTSTT